MKKIVVKLVLIGLLAWTLTSLLVFFPKHLLYPERHEILGFACMSQPDEITCGPASIAMVLNWYGKEVSIKEV